MTSDLLDSEAQKEYVQNIILNRGRKVDLYQYLRKHPEELLKGVLVAGSIGSGKTHRSISVIRSALDSGYGVLVFDPSNDYQRLLHSYEAGVVIDFSEYYLNPLEPPPGLSLKDWSSIFIQVFAQNFGLKDPSIAILQASLNNLIAKSYDNYPTLRELLEEVMQYLPISHSSETSSHASVQNRLKSVLESEWGRCLDVHQGYSPVDFEEGLLVIKIRPVGIERIHELAVGLTVAKIFAYRSWKQNRGEALSKNILIVIEEAHRFLSEGRQGDRYGQTLYLERALVESRKIGVGFVIIDQMPNRISGYVLGSCSMWIVCKLIDPNARRLAGEALRTDVVWSHIGLMELPIGAAIIKVDNQRELEETSPMVYRNEKHLYDVRGLPATVALPSSPEELLPSMESREVWEKMVQNERYMKYFERVIIQDYERVEKLLQEDEKIMIRRFISRTLNKNHGDTILDTEIQSEISRPMDRYQVDELKQLVGILSSNLNIAILNEVITSDKANRASLSKSVSRSLSWISRTLKNMLKVKIIREQSGLLFITDKGRRLLHWGELVSKERSLGISSIVIETDTKKLDYLLQTMSKYRISREKETIAGWRGFQGDLDEIIRTEYLLQYFIEQKTKDFSLNQLCIELFRILKISLESGILTSLLTNEHPITLEHLIKLSNVGERSTRRQLKLLEHHTIVKRFWDEGRRSVQLNQAWRLTLDHVVSSTMFESIVPVDLLHKAHRLAKDYSIREQLQMFHRS